MRKKYYKIKKNKKKNQKQRETRGSDNWSRKKLNLENAGTFLYVQVLLANLCGSRAHTNSWSLCMHKYCLGLVISVFWALYKLVAALSFACCPQLPAWCMISALSKRVFLGMNKQVVEQVAVVCVPLLLYALFLLFFNFHVPVSQLLTGVKYTFELVTIDFACLVDTKLTSFMRPFSRTHIYNIYVQEFVHMYIWFTCS